MNVSTSLKNEFKSLVRRVENSGSPDPLILAKYEAKIVESPPRIATAVPTCEQLQLENSRMQEVDHRT